MNKAKVTKAIKPVFSIATVKNGKINWVAQSIGKASNAKLEEFSKSLGEKVIRVQITEINRQAVGMKITDIPYLLDELTTVIKTTNLMDYSRSKTSPRKWNLNNNQSMQLAEAVFNMLAKKIKSNPTTE